MIEIFFQLFFGIFLGLIVGFLPGMSPNNLYPFILSFSFFSPLNLAIFITAFSISELITQFFPSIFLGAPSESTSISVLPGHKLLLKGRGYEALKICLAASLISLIFSILVVFISKSFFKQIYLKTREYIFYILIFVVIFTILSEIKIKKIIFSLTIFLLSGFLGLIVLNSPFPSSNLMFPLLSGFFGLSTLIISLKEKSYIPQQKLKEDLYIRKTQLVNSSLVGSVLGLIVGFLPGVGVSQAAVLAQTFIGVKDPRNFLAIISSINVANEIFSLNSLYLIGNPRSGTSVALQKILGDINFPTFLILISTVLFSFGITLPLVLFLSKKIYKILAEIDYFKLNLAIIFFLFFTVYSFTGFFGILVFVTSSSIGLLAIDLKVKRSHCMGCLLLPSLFFFSGYNSLLLSLLF